MIKVLFFAHLRDLAKTNEILVEAQAISKVSDLLIALKDKVPDELIYILSEQTAMVSINKHYATWSSELPDSSEVGILPPVSGG